MNKKIIIILSCVLVVGIGIYVYSNMDFEDVIEGKVTVNNITLDDNEKFFNKNGYYPYGNIPPVRYEVVEKFENGSDKFVKEYRNNKLYSDVEYYDNGIEKVRKNYIMVDNGMKPLYEILIKNYKSGKNKLWVIRNDVSLSSMAQGPAIKVNLLISLRFFT